MSKNVIKFALNQSAVAVQQAHKDAVKVEVSRYLGKLDAYALKEMKNGITAIFASKGQKEGCASMVRVLCNDETLGHKCRSFARFFGLSFTKENGEYIPKELRTKCTTRAELAQALKDVNSFADTVTEKPATPAKVKEEKPLPSNFEGVETLKKQMKSSVEAITKKAKASHNRTLEQYFAHCLAEMFSQKHFDEFVRAKEQKSVRARAKATPKA